MYRFNGQTTQPLEYITAEVAKRKWAHKLIHQQPFNPLYILKKIFF